MKEALEKLFRHSAVFLIGLIFQRAAKFLLLPLYWSAFPPSEFGLLDLFEVFMQIMVLVASFALPSAYMKLYRVDMGAGVSADALRGTTGVLALAILAVSVLGLWLFRAPISWLFFKGQYPALYAIACGAVAANAAFILFQGILRSHGRAIAYVVFSCITFVLLMTLNIYFIAIRGMGVDGVLWSALVAWGAPTVLYGVVRGVRLSWRFDAALAGRIVRFVLPLVPYGVLSFAAMSSGRLFLQHFQSAEAVGIFSAANRVGLILMLICVTPFQTAWGYLGLDFLRHGDAKSIYARAFTYLLSGGLFAFFGISFLGRALIVLFGGAAYWPAIAYIDPLMAGYLMLMFFYWANSILMHREMTGRVFLLTLPSFAIALAGGWVVIPHYGIAGACGVFVAAMAAQSLFITVYGMHLLGLSLERGRVGMALVSFGILYGMGRVAAAWMPAADLVVSLVLIPAYPIVLWLLGFLTDGEKEWMRSLPELVRKRGAGGGS